jgi:hypothetical protein
MVLINMATLRLHRDGEEEITGLPRVCMRCGAPATRTRSINFQDTIWRRQRVAVPLCEKHWYYARLSRVIRFFCAGTFLVGWSFLTWMRTILSWKEQQLVEWLVWCVFLVIVVVQWVSWYVLPSSIRPEKITNTYIELTGVAPQFVAAVVQEWEVFRQHFSDERRLRFNAAASGDERIIPSLNDVYRAKR